MMRDAQGLEVRGVVAHVTETIITLASTTGHRFRVAPRMMELNWTFSAAAPRTPMNCGRRGCPTGAVFRYTRDGVIEYVCPRHLPTSIEAELLTNSTVADPRGTRVQPPMPCPACASMETAEDLLSIRPHGAPWSWWTCQLCGRVWATISAPPADLVDAQSRGRWYETTIREAERHMSSQHLALDRIEMGVGAWGDANAADRWPERYSGWAIRMTLSVEPPSAHLILQDRARPVRPSPPLPVRRLGGRPNRPQVEAVGLTDTDRREFDEHRRNAQQAQAAPLPGRPLAPPPRPSPEPREEAVDPRLVTLAREHGVTVRTIRTLLTVVEPALAARMQTQASLPEMWGTLFASGAMWKSKQTGQEVEVATIGGGSVFAVVVATTLPMSMPLLTFIDTYEPSFDAKTAEDEPEGPPIGASIGEEWEEVSTGRVAVVGAINSKRRSITLTDMQSRNYVLAFKDFATQWRPFVRASAYEHLMNDDTLGDI